MSRVWEYFFMMITLIAGVSVGLFTGVKYNPNANISIDKIDELKTSSIKNVQDVVIGNVQNEINEKESDNLIEVSLTEIKISPYAKMVIKKKYKKCGHLDENIIDIPKEIINFTKDELQEKYTGWKIEEFSEDQVVLFREIDANCEDHFVIKENNGEVFVYKELTENKRNLIEKIDVNLQLLSDEDKASLNDGVRLYGKEALEFWKENYTS